MTLATHMLKTYVVSQAVRDHLAKRIAEEGEEVLGLYDLPLDLMDRLVVQDANPLTADELKSVLPKGKGNRSQRRRMGALDRRRPKRR